MIPTKIFLDLDDVCNKFTMHALKAVGCPVEADDLGKFNPEWGFDIIEAANALYPTCDSHFKFTLESFWKQIGRDVWRDAPESDEFRVLLDCCEHLVGRENICILTTPILDPECLAGKLEWIHYHFPKWMHRQYLMGPQKYLLADRHSLLIDDSGKNVREFREHGGQVILVPRPWNQLHNVKTEPHICNTLDIIFHKERVRGKCT